MEKCTVYFKKEEGQWVGVCKELGTATQADTFQQIWNELYEMIQLHLNALHNTRKRRELQDRRA